MPVDVGGIKIGGENIIRENLYRHWSALNPNSHGNGSSTIQDISGNNSDSSAVSDITWNNYYWGFGENFDDSSYIQWPNVSLGLPNANWTWETWIYPTDLTGKSAVIMMGNFDDSAGWDRGHTTGKIRGGFRSDSPNEDVAIIESSTLLINNWYHLAIRLDDSANEVEFWVNMVSQGTATMDSGNYSEGGNIEAGGLRTLSGSSPTERYKGGIAVFRIYNKALTEDELLYNFNAERGAFGI